MKAEKNMIPAFTIMELTIAMLISAIVIAFAYTGFGLIHKIYLDFNKKHQQLAVLLKVNELLKKDLARCEVAEAKPDELRLRWNNETVIYTFTPDYLLRTTTETDTFKVKLTAPRLQFEDQEIEQDESAYQLIDDLQFDVYSGSDRLPYHYYKYYSSAQLYLNSYASH
ncbi:hypothetical protein MUY27_20100 [Mucilaginibacter sp. RS28]|uniref:Prepilin-type N-terminal cleavage/methylation domain-containing protein n=1 Tax=Mucilaginibacter straminoryzae TaxID=2932774 RepID=A0A9X1X7R9_9SPHI|nr:hypothetical protein [Mucilaginibacter straminoryzae]MCJ8212030.1 hypothetical protein [Mucilaginibacter straminoryzae]